VLALALAACSADPDDPKAQRNLGEECVSCHRTGAKAASWPFTIGGTMYRAANDDPSPGLGDVTIVLTGADGKVLRLRSNRSGNFFAHEKLAFPVAVEVQRAGAARKASVAAGPCSSGACNACHTSPPRNGAPGRLFAPL
jgi:hypothetical protein